MLAALRARVGGSVSSSPDPYIGLSQPRILTRCAHVSTSISSLPLKELHQFFPHLLSNIFGYDRSEGWGLRLFNKTQHGDFPQLLAFLSPGGQLFHLIDKLESRGFLYEFPVGSLPRPSQLALSEGIIPAFYHNKIQFSLSVDSSPTHISLSAFEYFMFHFAFYFVQSQTNSWLPAQSHPDSLCVALFDAYLSHFLPFTGVVPGTLTTPLSHGSPQLNHSFSSSLNQSSFSPGRSAKQSPQLLSGPTRTEIFIQVLVEFWLNQNTYNGGRGDLLAQAQNQYTPSEEHMILLRRLLKQVHYFSCGFSYTATSASANSSFIPVTEMLRSSISSVCIQKRLFHFLNYSFKHSPLDQHFRYMLELWLTFIQPWRYTDPTKPSSENKVNFGKKWRTFVLENLPFYTVLFVEFLSRCFQADLTQENHVILLFRAVKVFSVSELMEYIRQGEMLLLDSPAKGSSPTSTSSIKAVFVDCVGPTADYIPLFGQDTQETIQSLLYKVCHCRSVLDSQTTPPGPGASPSPSESFFSLSTAQQEPTRRSLLKRFWDSVVEIFNEDGHPTQVGVASPVSDPSKLVGMLDSIANNISKAFKLPVPTLSSFEASLLGTTVPLDSSYSLPSHSSSSLPSSLEPDYYPGSSRLSPQGKLQVVQGLRKCSGKRIRYQGDPLLQPIRSYENATLVRLLYRLSSHLNQRYSQELASIGTGRGLVHKLLLQLLSAPLTLPSMSTPLQDDRGQPPATPINRVTPIINYADDEDAVAMATPRINLRPLASYYTLCYMSLAFLIVWLLSVPSLYCVLVAIVCVFVYCLLSYCVRVPDKKNN